MNPEPKLKYVRLSCTCPPICSCGGKVTRDWVHVKCMKDSYITSKGDIFCNNYGCSSYFIKDAIFKCGFQNDQTWYQFKNASQFIMALAMAIQSASFSLKDNDLVLFITDINAQVAKRWVLCQNYDINIKTQSAHKMSSNSFLILNVIKKIAKNHNYCQVPGINNSIGQIFLDQIGQIFRLQISFKQTIELLIRCSNIEF
ncbi:unnamed protein product [Paramecium sonneborni]|uniref:Uncharacterized protein n=1 Tax=Paramecium sonneborni TaxID=65129 RepID=A0A8S1NS88_9CILI|nr:unnamed protein product [Paramecium sonneborni]CAD8092353.1 unnamed protein product [Paramecium sonneborni]